MRLSTVRVDGGTRAALVIDDHVVLSDHTDVGEFLRWAEGDLGRFDAIGPELSIATADWATLVPHPNKVICLGLNYLTHIREMGRDTPAYPTLFAKYDGALIGAQDPIGMPSVSDQVDWEAELGVVIGRAARSVTKADALSHVAGYTVINDVTVRDWQHRTREFLSGKTFEATTPVGPVLVSAEELPPGASGLDISCEVDGQLMQTSNTSDLLFDVATIIAYVSQIITLLPGDLIATGTPGGVGAGRKPPYFLREGQTVTTTVEGIGQLSNVCAKANSPLSQVGDRTSR